MSQAFEVLPHDPRLSRLAIAGLALIAAGSFVYAAANQAVTPSSDPQALPAPPVAMQAPVTVTANYATPEVLPMAAATPVAGSTPVAAQAADAAETVPPGVAAAIPEIPATTEATVVPAPPLEAIPAEPTPADDAVAPAEPATQDPAQPPV